MGDVIRLHAPNVHVLAPGRERFLVCCVVGSFGSRADAEQAADLVADHLQFRGVVGILKRRRRLGSGTRFDLMVDERDVDHAVAVLRIAADLPCTKRCPDPRAPGLSGDLHKS
jgi:hypothetical protein